MKRKDSGIYALLLIFDDCLCTVARIKCLVFVSTEKKKRKNCSIHNSTSSSSSSCSPSSFSFTDDIIPNENVSILKET